MERFSDFKKSYNQKNINKLLYNEMKMSKNWPHSSPWTCIINISHFDSVCVNPSPYFLLVIMTIFWEKGSILEKRCQGLCELAQLSRTQLWESWEKSKSLKIQLLSLQTKGMKLGDEGIQIRQSDCLRL